MPDPNPLESIKYEDFAKIDLRVAKVLEARPHPNADKLMLLQIQVGDVEKQIVAGIRAHYTPEQLVGRRIIIVNNLEPAMLRGETSNGTPFVYYRGHLGQWIVSVPSKDAVFVRLGHHHGPARGDHPRALIRLLDEWVNP